MSSYIVSSYIMILIIAISTICNLLIFLLMKYSSNNNKSKSINKNNTNFGIDEHNVLETSYDLCNPGTYQYLGSCIKCNPGTYSDHSGAVTCTKCPKGTYTPSYGTISCLQCDQALEGSDTCL